MNPTNHDTLRIILLALIAFGAISSVMIASSALSRVERAYQITARV